MARTKADRDALEKYKGIFGHPVDYLQESISGHKMEHTTAEVDYETLVRNLGEDMGDITDVFPGAPESPFSFPRDDRGLESYRRAENALGDPSQRGQDDRDDYSPRDTTLKRKSRGSTGPRKRRSAVGGTTANSREQPNAGWLAQPDGRDNLEDESGPVQRDIRIWDGIKGNLQVLNTLSETLTSLATVVRDVNAKMPIMSQWIDKMLEIRAKHSQRMREARVKTKQLQGNPLGDDSAADMLVQLASGSDSLGGRWDDRGLTGRLGQRTTTRPISSSSSNSQTQTNKQAEITYGIRG
jgi:hypothetical protein